MNRPNLLFICIIKLCIILVFVLSTADADEPSVKAIEGSSPVLSCGTAISDMVVWKYQNQRTSHDIYLYLQGRLAADVSSAKYSVDSSSGGSTLTIKDVSTDDSGLYRCIEDGGIGKEHRMRLVVYEQEISNPTPPTSSTEAVVDQTGGISTGVIVLIVVSIVIVCVPTVISLCIYLIRKMRQREYRIISGRRGSQTAPQLQLSELPPRVVVGSLFEILEPVEIGSGSHTVLAIAELEGRLYVLMESNYDEKLHQTIRVFNLQGNNQFLREIVLDDTKYLVDIVACGQKKCLYVAAFDADFDLGSVWRIEPGDLRSRFLPKSYPEMHFFPYSLSIRSGRLLVTSNMLNVVTLYSVAGDVVVNVPLQGRDPVHAVETANKSFIVCCLNPRHTVCEFNESGGELHACSFEFGSPRYLTWDAAGRMFVADENAERVVVLKPDFTEELTLDCRIGLTEARQDIRPWHLCYVESTGELLVSVELSGKMYRFRKNAGRR